MIKAIIDLETTGFTNDDRIVELAIIKFDTKKGIISQYEQILNPGIPIPPESTAIHGITDDDVRGKPMLKNVIEDIIPHLEFAQTLISHNKGFDERIFRNDLKRCKVSLSAHFECTMQMARKIWPNRKSHALPELCKAMGIKHENKHRAMGDAMATYELYKRMRP